MINPTTSPSRILDNARWRYDYKNNLSRQIDRVILRVKKYKKTPDVLLRHFDSMLTLFEQGLSHTSPSTELKLIAFVRALHPLPVWWGKWSEWIQVLEKAGTLAQKRKRIDDQIWLQLKQAEMLLATGNGEKALVLTQKTFKTTKKYNKPKDEFYAEMLLFDIKKHLDQIKDILSELKSLELSLSQKRKLIRTKIAQRLEIELSLKKSDIYQRRSMIKKALSQSKSAYHLSQRFFDRKDPLMAKIHSQLGANYWAKNNYEKSITHYTQAIEIFRYWGDQTSQINAMGDMGLVYWSAEKYKKAEKVLENSIRMAEEINAKVWQTIQIGDLGLVNLSQGKLHQAKTLMEQHYKLSILTNNNTEKERADSNVAIVYLHTGNFKEAYMRLKRCLKSAEKEKHKISIGIIKASIAWALEGLGRQEEAIKYAEETLEYTRKSKIPSLNILALCAISEVVRDKKSKIKYAKKALKMARKHSHQFNEAGALFVLSNSTQDNSLRDEAIAILKDIGAEGWLNAPIVFDRIRLPLLL